MAQQGLFRKKPQSSPSDHDPMLEMIRRSRTLEERYSHLEKRSQVTEENMIDHHRKLSSEIRAINDDVRDLRKQISDLNEKIGYLINELSGFARKDDVGVLKKYIDYWEPVRFVTARQVEKIVTELLEDHHKK